MFNIKTRKEKMMVTKARLEGLDKDLTLVLGLTVVGNVLAETGTIPMVPGGEEQRRSVFQGAQCRRKCSQLLRL